MARLRTAASFIAEEPEYSKVAARLLAGYIDKEVHGLGVYSFSQSIRVGFDAGLINERVLAFVEANARKLNDAIDAQHTQRFEYFGLRTLYDRYLLKHPTLRQVIETPQQFWLRVACSLSGSVAEAIELYGLFARLDYVLIPTAVFSLPNIGTVGLTEEEAREAGHEVVIYESRFRPMKLTLTECQEKTLMKLVVDGKTDKVLGCHMVGPDAGEIVQGLAIALKAGATKRDFDDTIGVHPTAAEEFVTMRTPVGA